MLPPLSCSLLTEKREGYKTKKNLYGSLLLLEVNRLHSVAGLFVFGANILDFFAVELPFDVLVKERTRRTFALDVKLKNFPKPRRHIVIPVHISAAEFKVKVLLTFIIIYLVYGR